MSQTSKKLQKEFGHHVRKLRHGRGWTLEETEEHGWVSWRHLQQIESGQKNVTLETIVKLAKLYKVTPSDLLKNL